MKLLIDMNLSPRWAEFLNRAGWETVHWSLVGKASATDSELMGYAAQHDQVVITYDSRFRRNSRRDPRPQTERCAAQD